jgi:hypothetical protein
MFAEGVGGKRNHPKGGAGWSRKGRADGISGQGLDRPCRRQGHGPAPQGGRLPQGRLPVPSPPRRGRPGDRVPTLAGQLRRHGPVLRERRPRVRRIVGSGGQATPAPAQGPRMPGQQAPGGGPAGGPRPLGRVGLDGPRTPWPRTCRARSPGSWRTWTTSRLSRPCRGRGGYGSGPI